MRRDIIVVGASSGGIEAVSTILRGLPTRFPAAMFVTIHISPAHPSLLPHIFNGAGDLPAAHPKDREKYHMGRIYVAPPDRHLLVERDRIRVLRSATENLHRPAIDPLFRSAAFYGRSRVAGVLLTGSDTDGTSGLFSIKMRGGVTIVQDPVEAHSPVMPWSALQHVSIDHTMPLSRIAPLLIQLAEGRFFRREGARHAT